MDFEFDCLVVPVNNPIFEIEGLNRYLYKGIDQSKKEFLLERADGSIEGKHL